MLIRQFLDYLRYERGYSALTVQNYGKDLKDFESYVENLDSHLSLEKVDSDVIRDWMESMMDRGNTATTICRRLSAVRSFYRFALSVGIVKSDPALVVKGPKKGRPLPQFLREEEIGTLLDGDGMWGDGFKDIRARTILDVFYETGIRLAELTGLDDKDVDFAGSQLKVTGKRNKQRIIPFGRELRDELEHYLLLRARCCGRESGPLFVDAQGMRLTVAQVRRQVRFYLSQVTSLTKRTPHVLRHTFATVMLNNGADLTAVKELLGHESLATTEIYTHTSFAELRKEYEKAHPRGGNGKKE